MKGKYPNRLQEFMDTASVGPTKLARLAGTSKQNVSRFAAGERELTPVWARKFAKIVGATAQELVFSEKGFQVPIMGYIGAGEEIEPDYEQVPPEGLDDVELPFAVSADMIGLQIRGDSMWPAYRDGDVIVVHREQRRPTEQLVGDEAAVLTHDGRRYLKRIAPGPMQDTFNLESLNARFATIVAVGIRWANYPGVVVRASQVRHVRTAWWSQMDGWLTLVYIAFGGTLAWFAWKERSSEFAYCWVFFAGLGALSCTIGNGPRDEAPYAWVLTVALGLVGLAIHRMR